jgi:hypothetical protein
MVLSEPIQITSCIAKELDRLGIHYLVGGSLASSLHGAPRATHDVDIVADINENHIPEVVKALEPEFYIDAEMLREAVQMQSMVNIIHRKTMFKIDIFILKSDAVSHEEMKRREQYQLSESQKDSFYIATAEDTIVQKLYWYQLGGCVSDRQWNDVISVLRVQQHGAILKRLPGLKGLKNYSEKP